MLELRNYEENTKAGEAAAGVLSARASASRGGPVSADRPFPPGMEYEQSAMGVIPVSNSPLWWWSCVRHYVLTFKQLKVELIIASRHPNNVSLVS